MEKLEKRIKQLKSLTQYANKSDSEIEAIAKEQIERKAIFSEISFLIDDKEKKLAQELISSYLKEYNFSSFSDKDTLKNLVYFEVLGERIKNFINKEAEEKNGAIPTHMVEQLIANSEQIIRLKEQLGIARGKDQDITFLQTWNQLKEKALKYYEEHKGCNTVKCPYCQKMFHLLLRTEGYDAIKSSWFKGTILFNKKLFELYDEKKITKEETAEVLGVSTFYIDLLYDQEFLKEKAEDKNAS